VKTDTSYFRCNGIPCTRTQLPLQNAFALTIHKVQGLSLPSICISLDRDIFSVGQAYTALSRAKRLEDVSIDKLDWSAFKVDHEAIKEYKRLEAKALSIPEIL
jgi:ATP-dependent DNA helicase PIF1